MTELEQQADELLKSKNWKLALDVFDQILSNSLTKQIPKERLISLLVGRIECAVELGRHETIVLDCRKVVKLETDPVSPNLVKIRKRLISSLAQLRRYSEAESATQDWIKSIANDKRDTKPLEHVRSLLHIANGQKNARGFQKKLDDELAVLDQKLESSKTKNNQANGKESMTCNGVATPSTEKSNKPTNDCKKTTSKDVKSTARNSYKNQNGVIVLPNNQETNQLFKNAFNTSTPYGGDSKLAKVPQVTQKKPDDKTKKPDKPETAKTATSSSEIIMCTYCSVSFSNRMALQFHCQSESHEKTIMSDDGRDWKWRAPPRGYTADSYALCENYQNAIQTGVIESDTSKLTQIEKMALVSSTTACKYGAQCVEAHGVDELLEWRERFEYRKIRVQRAREKKLYGKKYTEMIMEKWVQSVSPGDVMKENLNDVKDSCSTELVTTVASKSSKREWEFILTTKRYVKAVALLQDAHRNHFSIKQIILYHEKISGKVKHEMELTDNQEWCNPAYDATLDIVQEDAHYDLRVKIAFNTDIYGTFRQTVVFDFGNEPLLIKHICVDVVPAHDYDKIKEIRKEVILAPSQRWDAKNCEIVPFEAPNLLPNNLSAATVNVKDVEWEKQLLNTYPTPNMETFTLTNSTITEKRLSKNNYRERQHELLYIEEMARYEQVARYNLTTKLTILSNYPLTSSGMATTTTKYSQNGEFFAKMLLSKDVSEDTSSGRLILNNCTSVLIADYSSNAKVERKRKVFEAVIEDKSKHVVYFRLSADTVKHFSLKADTDFNAEVQFQLNRIPYCEWHYSIDKVSDFGVIFPDVNQRDYTIPWSPQRQWDHNLDGRLNAKQKEAILAITTPYEHPLPPILIIGPFGTGKTFTLAQAIKRLLEQPDSKILICTHSNSAADLYIKDYLHPYVEEGHTEATPLRVYYHKRWVATVNSTVQKYCLIDNVNGQRSFRIPTFEDMAKYRIIVVTLSISMYLSTMGLKKGYFTHVLLDEAAQAMECEAIMPLALADERTRIVLAGDHMQLSPELFSEFAKERNLHVSLLERLYDHYPNNFPCKILLCENYRAHEAIIRYTSELFYDQKLVASGKQPRHDKYYPLTFFTTRGEDIQDSNSTAFYNNSEVYEVVERVNELRKKWPSAWGKFDDQSIGIMTPYADQVFRIRAELRRRRMGGISVERVLNVQGKQFRAIFLSTVRTRRTCTGSASTDEMDFGFLSNSKLLNTAITRAQSLVAVVGDPIALCSIGRCRKVWERFIDICNQNNSLFGITWSQLRSQLDGVELKKTYVLNPLAPEFVPRKFQTESYIKMPTSNVNSGGSVPKNPFISALQSASGTQPSVSSSPQSSSSSMYQMPVYFNQQTTTQKSSNVGNITQRNISSQYSGTVASSSQPWAASNGNSFSNLPLPMNVNNEWPSDYPKKNQSDLMASNVDIINAQLLKGHSLLQMPSNENFQSDFTNDFDSRRAMAPIDLQMSQKDKPEKDPSHIQFLNNVHFPEAKLDQQLVNANDNIFNNLMLPAISASEMLMQPAFVQIEWYRRLIEAGGMQMANKFLEVVMQNQAKKDNNASNLNQINQLNQLNQLQQLNQLNHFNQFVPLTNDLTSNLPSTSTRVDDLFSDKSFAQTSLVAQGSLPPLDVRTLSLQNQQQQQQIGLKGNVSPSPWSDMFMRTPLSVGSIPMPVRNAIPTALNSPANIQLNTPVVTGKQFTGSESSQAETLMSPQQTFNKAQHLYVNDYEFNKNINQQASLSSLKQTATHANPLNVFVDGADKTHHDEFSNIMPVTNHAHPQWNGDIMSQTHPHHNIPLYRRQGQRSDTPGGVHHGPDVRDVGLVDMRTNVNEKQAPVLATASFSGYARASINQSASSNNPNTPIMFPQHQKHSNSVLMNAAATMPNLNQLNPQLKPFVNETPDFLQNQSLNTLNMQMAQMQLSNDAIMSSMTQQQPVNQIDQINQQISQMSQQQLSQMAQQLNEMQQQQQTQHQQHLLNAQAQLLKQQQMNYHLNQHYAQQHLLKINAPTSKLKNDDLSSEVGNKPLSYASVLRSASKNDELLNKRGNSGSSNGTNASIKSSSDPLALLRNIGNKSVSTNGGLYQYFT